MAGYDWSMLALVLGVAIFSSWRGLLWQLSNIGAFFVGGMFVYVYLDVAAPLLRIAAPWNRLAAGAMLYAIGALFTYVLANACRRLLRTLSLEALDRHLGFVWGLCEGAALALTLTLLLLYASTDPAAPVRHSHAARVSLAVARAAAPLVPTGVSRRLAMAAQAIRTAASPSQSSRGGSIVSLLFGAR